MNKCKVCGIRFEGKVCPNCSIKCTNCNYNWNTRSKLLTVTCPSCQLKVQNEKRVKE